MKKRNLVSTIFTFLLILSVKAFAFRLEPMVADFAPSGSGAIKTFRVDNDGKEKLGVKIQAFVRQIDENGKETMVESKDFKIYPDQLSLSASDSRAVRVTYTGPQNIDQERAYRIVASQLPVSFKEESQKTGIKFLYQYVASAYVTSEKFYPKIEVESITKVDKDNIKIKIINKGQKHTLLNFVDIELQDTNGKRIKLDSKFVNKWEGENILSGTRRTFKVKSQLNFDINKAPPKIEIMEEK